ncbi:MAG: hypothetical protein KA132_03045 [Thauera sp.]|nr:hypothetical protein [Thauera sp.]
MPAHTARVEPFPMGCRPDAVVLDLEDFVPEAEKARARARIGELVRGFTAHGIDVLVRINRPLDEAVADLREAVRAEVRGVLVTKACGAQHLELLGEFVSSLEVRSGLPDGHTRFVPLVETAAGLQQIEAIAAGSPRNAAIALGGEDLARECRMLAGRDTLAHAKARLVAAAVAAGILPWGYLGSVADFRGGDDFRALVAASRDFGFRAATCLRAEQVDGANAGYAPQEEELAWAYALPAHASPSDQAEAAWLLGRAASAARRPTFSTNLLSSS